MFQCPYIKNMQIAEKSVCAYVYISDEHVINGHIILDLVCHTTLPVYNVIIKKLSI